MYPPPVPLPASREGELKGEGKKNFEC